MDLRVLAAVFLTLLAVAVGMAQGTLDVQGIQDAAEGLKTGGDLSGLLQQAGTSAANTTITGTIVSPRTADLRIGARSRLELAVSGETAVDIGDSTLQTADDSELVVRGFTGRVHISPDNMTVTGTVTGVSTPTFDFSYGSPKKFSVHSPTPRIAVSRLERQTFRFANATGTVNAGGTSVAVDQERAWFRGFSGNLSVDGTTYELAGTVRSAALGDAEIG
ncbi:MAG: hypothetical protein SVU88_02100 [Candidatus Nanohaloarchaea archaeon]|nr:hypothetical protein [Candidatus Nanohaloarchaea archaeon]